MDIGAALSGEYDVGFFGDVIEHLKDPKRALVAVRHSLAEGGYVIVSVPNVAHASIRLALLKGQFDYEEVGILDSTHLRFYTRESIADLLESCGYMVEVMDWVEQKVDERTLRETLDPLGLQNMEEVVKAFSEWEAVAFQFVIKAIPATEEAQVQRLSEEKVAAEHRLRVVEKELAELKKALLMVEKLQGQLDDMNLEMEKSAEYQKSLESAINAKDAYIAQLETAVSESRERLEQCETKINEMASMLETIESAPPAKKKRGLLSDR
jgi:hypothetical protein